MSTYSDTRYRREGLKALAVLLEEAGQQVLATGKSVRVAGGTLRLSRRKASSMFNPATGKWRRVGEVLRLTWRGPRIPAQATRCCKSTPDAGTTQAHLQQEPA